MNRTSVRKLSQSLTADITDVPVYRSAHKHLSEGLCTCCFGRRFQLLQPAAGSLRLAVTCQAVFMFSRVSGDVSIQDAVQPSAVSSGG